MKLQTTWKDAKRAWEKDAVKHVRRAVLDEMGEAGWGELDLGKLLGKVDAAKNLAARRVAWAPAKGAVVKYQKAVAKARQADLDPRGKKGLATLGEALASIASEADAACQDPAPSQRAKELRLVSALDLAAGLKPVHLRVGKLEVSAWLVVDEMLLALEKSGDLGFHWSEIQREVTKLLADATKRFQATILELDAKLVILDEQARAARLAEAKQVLEFYRKVVERRINEIVDSYWGGALRRQEYLKSFKKECKVDIAVATVTIAVSTTSLAMSFGTAAVGVLAIAKAALEIALTLEKMSRGADAVKAKLEPKMEEIKELWSRRREANRQGRVEHGSKALEAGKEAVASAMGQISREFMTTTSRTQKEAREFVGKLSIVEAEAGRLYKQIVVFTSKFPSSPTGPDAHANEKMRAVHMKFLVMAQQYEKFAEDLREDIKWGENCVEVCGKLSDEDWVPQWTKTTGTATKSAIGVAAAAKLVYDLATALV